MSYEIIDLLAKGEFVGYGAIITHFDGSKELLKEGLNKVCEKCKYDVRTKAREFIEKCI